MAQDIEFLGAPMDSDEEFSLTLVRAQGGLLLGEKTRGFGTGKLVLPGGKDQFYLSASGIGLLPDKFGAVRELGQETGLNLPEAALTNVGNLYVTKYGDDYDDERHIKLFEAVLPAQTSTDDTDELIDLSWHPESDLPYDRMPDDYKLWLPHIVGGFTVDAFFEIDENDKIYGKMFGHPRDGQGRMVQFPVPAS
jgi:8-oxo-dGTP diphosphatase